MSRGRLFHFDPVEISKLKKKKKILNPERVGTHEI